MPYRAWNKASAETKRRFFELIRQGWSGQAASLAVGVSPSCGSLWFIDAGRVQFVDTPISSRYLSQHDRIEIADGLAAGESVKAIAARIGKSYQTVYREIARNRKPDGRYQPWFAHNRAYERRRRPRPRRLAVDADLRAAVAGRLAKHWSPRQISRWLRRRWPRRRSWHLSIETIYEAVYRGLVIVPDQQTLRTGRAYRHKRGRGRSRDGALKQSTAMKSIQDRPAIVVAHADRALGRRFDRRCRAAICDRHLGGTQDPAHVPDPDPWRALSAAGRRCPHRRVQHTAAHAAPHPNLGPGQRDVPPPAHRAADRTEDLLRRRPLALATRHEREHERALAPVLPQEHQPRPSHR